MKKIVVLFLAFSLMLSITACGSKDVEVRLPISMLVEEGEDLDFESISSQAKENGIKDVIQNEDGSVTYLMSKDKHVELMDNMEKNIAEVIREAVEGNTFESVKAINPSKDYREFEIVVNKEKYEGSFDSFIALGMGMQSMYYQVFNGNSSEKIKATINIKDESTGEVFDRIIYPDDLENVE